MSAAEHGKGVEKRHPAFVAGLLLVTVGVLSLFPIILHANAMAMIDGYRASHGQAGTAGTVTVESALDTKGRQRCEGTFVSDDGPDATGILIELPGRCEEGQEIEVRLMDGRPSMFRHLEEPRAWAAGSKDWFEFLPLVLISGVLSLPLVILAYMIIAKLAKLVFLPRDAPKV
jgi:hypothetical protein